MWLNYIENMSLKYYFYKESTACLNTLSIIIKATFE